LDFFDYKIGGMDFGGLIKRDHPAINKENHEEYIDKFYKENKEELKEKLVELNNSIEETQEIFFKVLEKIFDYDFSNKDYGGALSIFDCNPRYLEEETFQVYYKRGPLNKRKVAYHEVLHFIFFDYCDNNLSDLVSDLDKNNGPYWALSEIFNVIVLNFVELQGFLKDPEGMFYPNLKKVYPEIEKIWKNSNGNMREFVEKSLDVLKK
jgi:hypothetical protein